MISLKWLMEDANKPVRNPGEISRFTDSLRKNDTKPSEIKTNFFCHYLFMSSYRIFEELMPCRVLYSVD